MPFVVSKTVANAVASTVIAATPVENIDTIEKKIPIHQKFLEPKIEMVCKPSRICYETVINTFQERLIGYYVTYRKNGKLITVEELL